MEINNSKFEYDIKYTVNFQEQDKLEIKQLKEQLKESKKDFNDYQYKMNIYVIEVKNEKKIVEEKLVELMNNRNMIVNQANQHISSLSNKIEELKQANEYFKTENSKMKKLMENVLTKKKMETKVLE